MFDLTLFGDNAHARFPLRHDTFETWDDVADAIEDLTDVQTSAPPTASREQQKLGLLAFGPYRMRTGEARSNAAVVHLSLIVLDVDDHLDLESTLDRLEALGPALVYASPSDTPDHRRVRIIMPPNRPITPTECKHSRFALAKALRLHPECGVKKTHEAARIFFCGRLHDTPKRDVWRIG